jgi:hypothetical protein
VVLSRVNAEVEEPVSLRGIVGDVGLRLLGIAASKEFRRRACQQI